MIAYIGNKRRLLGFLQGVFSELSQAVPIRRFLDPFAGSGAVSRLGRKMGFQVFSGDAEEYSRVLVSAAVRVGPGEAEALLRPWGGWDIYRELDDLGASGPGPVRPYISAYYAPADTLKADYRKERLFYTRENALFIDRVRERIEDLVPGDPPDPELRLAKDLMLAPLLYGAATRANTSGVFKACHKGFGGHGKDALGRIMSPLSMEPPPLIDGLPGAQVLRSGAEQFLEQFSGDVVYLDPPYNQHQYGSNYHLLNTIALWDCPVPDNRRDEEGTLINRSGIRRDWVGTRSGFCSSRTVLSSFESVLQKSRSRFIALSYSNEGLLPLEELHRLLNAHGRVCLYMSDYTAYRGGRQSPVKRNSNLEMLFLVDRLREYRGGWNGGEGEQAGEFATFLALKKIDSLLRGSFHPRRLQEHFPSPGGELLFLHPDTDPVATDRFYRFSGHPPRELLANLTDKDLEQIIRGLEASSCRDRQEEAQILCRFLVENPARGDLQRLGTCLRKLVHRKYARIWEEEMDRARNLCIAEPKEQERLRRILDDLVELAQRRFSG